MDDFGLVAVSVQRTKVTTVAINWHRVKIGIRIPKEKASRQHISMQVCMKSDAEKGARTKIERNLEIACFMDEHDNRRRGEVDI
jgi:hypothetical protein